MYTYNIFEGISGIILWNCYFATFTALAVHSSGKPTHYTPSSKKLNIRKQTFEFIFLNTAYVYVHGKVNQSDLRLDCGY